MSGFGPPPGPPEAPVRPRRPNYLPPGPRSSTSGVPGVAGASQAAYRARYALTRSAKPGIIPLAPLRLGDLLDGSVKHVRRNPGPVLGVSAVVNALAALPVIALVGAALAGSWLRTSRVSTVLDSAAIPPLLGFVGTAYATLVLSAVLSYAAAEAALGRRPAADAIWAAVRPRIWTVLGTPALVVLIGVLPWGLLVGMLAIAAQETVPVILLVGTGFGLLAVAANAVILPRIVLSGPASVLEGLTIGKAFARSWRLAQGRYWSIVGVAFVVGALAVVIFWTLELPQLLLLNTLIDLFELNGPTRDAAGSAAFALANLGAAILVTPFVATSVCLVYLDTRIRKEGFDLALLRAVTPDHATPGHGGARS